MDQIGAREAKIGRASNNDIVVAHDSVSAHHAILKKDGESNLLMDLSSTNGTFVNGKRISEIHLVEGDLINFGPISFIFKKGNLQLKSELENTQENEEISNDGIRNKKIGVVVLLIIAATGVLLSQFLTESNETPDANSDNSSLSIPTTSFVQTTTSKMTTSTAGVSTKKSPVEIAAEAILLNDYEWGVYSSSTLRLQDLLKIPPDGIYGSETRGAHISVLREKNLSTFNVPPVPATTTSPPKVGSSDFDNWEELVKSVVLILADCGYGEYYSGSGTLVLNGGYVLTNEHVLTNEYGSYCELVIFATNKASDLPLWFANGEIIPQATDPLYDLAVIRLVDKNSGVPIIAKGRKPVEIKDIELSFGSELRVLGYPGSGGERITIASGEQSGWIDDSVGDGEFYKTSAKGGSGVSGGAGFDALTGDFIGVPTAVKGSLGGVGDTFLLIRPNRYVLPILNKAEKHG